MPGPEHSEGHPFIGRFVGEAFMPPVGFPPPQTSREG